MTKVDNTTYIIQLVTIHHGRKVISLAISASKYNKLALGTIKNDIMLSSISLTTIGRNLKTLH